MKIASEEDLLTLDASTGKKTYRHFTPEDYRLFETETILMRDDAQCRSQTACHDGQGGSSEAVSDCAEDAGQAG